MGLINDNTWGKGGLLDPDHSIRNWAPVKSIYLFVIGLKLSLSIFWKSQNFDPKGSRMTIKTIGVLYRSV